MSSPPVSSTPSVRRTLSASTARSVVAGATVSFQIHYTPNGKATQDQIKMGLIFSRTPPRFQMQTVAVADRAIIADATNAPSSRRPAR